MKTQYTQKKKKNEIKKVKSINNSHWKNVLDRVNVERERERGRFVCSLVKLFLHKAFGWCLGFFH